MDLGDCLLTKLAAQAHVAQAMVPLKAPKLLFLRLLLTLNVTCLSLGALPNAIEFFYKGCMQIVSVIQS